MREEFTCPVPGGHRFRNGDGPKIIWNGDNTLTCSWDRPVPVRQVMALDEQPPDDGSLRELCSLLRENLDPDVYSKAEQLLVHLMGGGPDVYSPDVVLNANDEPAPFRGQPPRPGIDRRFTPPLAGDSRALRELVSWEKSFRARFPTARRPRQL